MGTRPLKLNNFLSTSNSEKLCQQIDGMICSSKFALYNSSVCKFCLIRFLFSLHLFINSNISIALLTLFFSEQYFVSKSTNFIWTRKNIFMVSQHRFIKVVLKFKLTTFWHFHEINFNSRWMKLSGVLIQKLWNLIPFSSFR